MTFRPLCFLQRQPLLVLLIPSLLLCTRPSGSAVAQSITPAPDGTGTVVRRQGDRYDIEGGSRSRDGANLFHSFEQLGLNTNEIANFLANPTIENILGRVTGGNASVIDGLLQVTGGNANLYLLNPAGILFGPNARLNLPASFTATTATGIGFDAGWFTAIDTSNYAALTGHPQSFAFTMTQPGAIANFGDLAVSTGERLTLLGGTVLNVGTLSAPGGTITVAAIPGQNRVRMSQEGRLLSLELETTNGTWEAGMGAVPFTPLTLPELLTGGGLTNASAVTVNPDGTIQLSGSHLSTPPGTAIASGTLDASASSTPDIPHTPEVNVLGDRVALINATVNVASPTGGGQVRIGGDYQGDGSVFNASRTFVDTASVIQADAEQAGVGGQVIVWGNAVNQFGGTITARGGFYSGDGGFVEVSSPGDLVFRGIVDVTANQGNIGTLLLDPTNITIANAPSSEGLDPLPSEIDADVLPGSITINAATLGDQLANIVLEATNDLTIASGLSLTFAANGGSITLRADAGNSDGVGSFRMDPTQTLTALNRDINISGANVVAGTIVSRRTEPGLAEGGTVTLRATNGNVSATRIDTVGETVSLSGANVTVGDMTTNRAAEGLQDGGTVSLEATNGRVSVGTVNTSTRATTNPQFGDSGGAVGNAGALTITATDGITTGDLQLSSINDGDGQAGNGGNVSLRTTRGNITTGTIQTPSLLSNANASGQNSGNGGRIELRTAGGAITVNGEILTNSRAGNAPGSSSGTGGTIALTASGTIALTGSLDSSSSTPTEPSAGIAGSITLNAASGTTIGSIPGSDLSINGPVTAIGDLTIRTDQINLSGSLAGDGNLTLVPATPDQAIVLGGTAGSDSDRQLDIRASDLAILQDGFNAVTIGRSDGSGAITLAGDITLKDPLILRSPASGGSINTIGGTITGNASTPLTLAADQIRTGTITNPGQSISLNSPSGAIDTTAGRLTGRDITLTALGTIATADLLADQTITLSSTAGAINTTAGSLTARDITLTAAGAIATANLLADQTITLSSTSGAINTTGGTITGGEVLVTTSGSVNLGSVNGDRLTVRGSAAGRPDTLTLAGVVNADGAVDLRSDRTLTLTGSLSTTNDDLSIDSRGDIVLNGAIQTQGGDITISGATLTATAPINSSVANAEAGEIALTARRGTLRTADLLASGRQSGSGGTITLNAQEAITTGNVVSNGGRSGDGGPIRLTSNRGSITTGNLNSSGDRGGDIEVQAATAITSRRIITRGRQGNGGNVLLDPVGDVVVRLINAEGGNAGSGGTVSIMAGRFFRATERMRSQNGFLSSISTVGGEQGGGITIRHGGQGITPFNVSNLLDNGTAGVITSGEFTIEPPQSYPFTTQVGNIGILSVAPPAYLREDLTQRSLARLPDLPGVPGAVLPQTDPVAILESSLTEEYIEYLNLPVFQIPIKTLADAQQELRLIDDVTGSRSVLLYVYFAPAPQEPTPEAPGEPTTDPLKSTDPSPSAMPRQRSRLAPEAIAQSLVDRSESLRRDDDQLQLLLVTASGQPIRKSVPITRAEMQRVTTAFRSRVTQRNTRPSDYLPRAKQLYEWMVAPVEEDLKNLGIQTISFILDAGLRSLPVSALHDGDRYLIESYSVGMMPSFSLTDTRYTDLRDAELLAMGASQFQDLPPLPAVPVELNNIAAIWERDWESHTFLNQSFTLDNLLAQRSQDPVEIIHLATHAEFVAGAWQNSYIQFWNQKLSLDQISRLQFDEPRVDLLVLSACKTAVGNREAELGFAGAAAKVGVRSIMASLWYVSDTGTLALMTEFYRQLKATSIKAEALRRTQLALMRGQVRLQDGNLVTEDGTAIALSPDFDNQTSDFSHPFFWASFTMVGSPW